MHGVSYMLVEKLEIVCATGVWDPGVSGIVHCDGDAMQGSEGERGEGSERAKG